MRRMDGPLEWVDQTNKLGKGKVCFAVQAQVGLRVPVHGSRILDAHYEFVFSSALYKNFSFATKYTRPRNLFVYSHSNSYTGLVSARL